jgi:hypothetical protein
VIVGVAVDVAVFVEVGVEVLVGVGVKVGPSTCPAPQLVSAGVRIIKATMRKVRCFIISFLRCHGRTR